MKDLNLLTTEQLVELIEIKRNQLSQLFLEQGLNDITLKKSQELDELIVRIQREWLSDIEEDDEQSA